VHVTPDLLISSLSYFVYMAPRALPPAVQSAIIRAAWDAGGEAEWVRVDPFESSTFFSAHWHPGMNLRDTDSPHHLQRVCRAWAHEVRRLMWDYLLVDSERLRSHYLAYAEGEARGEFPLPFGALVKELEINVWAEQNDADDPKRGLTEACSFSYPLYWN
jgi:hypothetical protein